MSSPRGIVRLGQSPAVVALLAAFLGSWPGVGFAQSPTAQASLYEVSAPLDGFDSVRENGDERLGPRELGLVGRRWTAWGCEGFAASSEFWG